MISCASVTVSQAWRNASTSNSPPGPTNFIRFSDARLQAESSRNMYSEHGFDALMRAVAFEVCQRLSSCRTASPDRRTDAWAAQSRALIPWRLTFSGLPVGHRRVHQSPSPPPPPSTRRSPAPNCWRSGRKWSRTLRHQTPIVSGIDQRVGLFFFFRLAPDERFDVG